MADGMTPAILVRDLWLTYPGRQPGAAVPVLERVDLEVQQGEFACLVGPSGCGKSTLLNVLGGFLSAVRGQVMVQGEPVAGPDPRRIFVFQENGVFPWLTVEENVGFGLMRKSADEKQRLVAHYLCMVGLVGFEHAYPHELSGGMRQRVELARALAANPEILYMDEPFGALDFITRLKMRADLTRIWQNEHKTVVFVTHDVEEAVQLADRVLVMSQRPATIHAVLDVNLPRPRELGSPGYLEARDHIFELLGMSLRVGDSDRPGAEATVSDASRRRFRPQADGNGGAVEYLIIGAGPAGLQLGYFLSRVGRDYLIVEAGPAPGMFFHQFPRHRRLISINKSHTGWTDPELNLRTDWNSLLSDNGELLFTRYSQRYFPAADDLVRYLEDFANAFKLRIAYNSRITRITRDGHFRVTDTQGRSYEAQRLVLATGVSQPYIPAIPGIETAEFYGTVTVDPDDFVDQRVLIIGKGNSAFETADNLVETAAVIHVAGPSSIRMAWKSHYVGHLRAVNNNLLDTYQLKSQNALLDGNIVSIERRAGSYYVTISFARANEIKKTYRYDRVIVCTGFRFDASIFADACCPELMYKDRLPAQTSAWESTNVGDLYFAGTLMQVRDYKKSTCGFIHGFRYGVCTLHHILEARYHGTPWPHRHLPAEPQTLTEAVITRVNRTSALWQLFGTLGDLIIASRDGSARYYEEVPVDYIHDSDFGSSDSYFVITLEYGPGHDTHDPFDISVGRITQSDAERAHEGRYLHPVVRHYDKRTLVAEHHVVENLENDWTGSTTHRQPLSAFFAHALNPSVSTAALVDRETWKR